jgi:hypothetical protein
MEIIINLLNKDNRHSETNTQKYEVINCQNMFDKNIDTTKYIKLLDIIKESSDMKIFDALFAKTQIVIKIGKSDTIIREYKISIALYNQNLDIKLDDKYIYLTKIKNIIKYICYFSCKNNLICSNNGDELKILIMKKYELGNIKNYDWNENNFNILLELIKQIFFTLYISYENYGFIHNDVH